MQKKYFLISHNEYALGIKKALEMIIGKQENTFAFGLMPGGHPDLIIKQIENQISPEDKVVILGDIAGGSVCNAAMRLTLNSNVTLVTGTNLPLAVEIIAAQIADREMIEQTIQMVRESVKILELEKVEEQEDFFN